VIKEDTALCADHPLDQLSAYASGSSAAVSKYD